MNKTWSICLLASLVGACNGGGGDGSSSTATTVNSQTGFLNQLEASPVAGAAGYAWRFQAKPSGSDALIDGADEQRAEFEPDVAGTYVVRLEVSDGSSATITVNASGPTTGWKRLGHVLDINYGEDARNPDIATDAAGTPLVVWEESDPSSNNFDNVYAKRWNGSTWNQLGAGPLDNAIENEVYEPRIAIDPTDGNPVVAWIERDGGIRRVFVRKWDGSSTWDALGGALNADAANDAFPRVDVAVGADGNPVVVWSEFAPDAFGNISDVFVAKWDGISTWTRLGTPRDVDDIDKDPAVAIDAADGNPVVAWTAGNAVATTYFGDLVVQKWDGANWNTLDSNFESSFFFGPEATVLAVGADSLPIVAWHESESQPIGQEVGIRKYNGADFATVIATPNPSNDHSPSVLADPADDLPLLAFTTTDSLLVKKWNGIDTWTQYGERVNYRHFPGPPALAFGAGAVPVVAWDDEPSATYSRNVYVKIRE